MNSVMQVYHTTNQKKTKKKPAGKTNQQGPETGYQMTKVPDLHHAQQSLTHLIQSSTKVNTNMQRIKKDTPPLNTAAVKL
jgi:hypothetical protein